MAKRPLPPQELLLQLLHYEPETGFLYWRQRGAEHFKDGIKSATHNMRVWNRKYAGKLCGSLSPFGYYTTRVNDISYMCHRLIWKIVSGVDADLIDHINGNRIDNRIENLRNVDSAGNARNSGSRRTSGFRGVRKLRSHVNSWQARITVNRIDLYLGNFPTFEGAVQARKEAEVKHGFHPNHGRSLV